MGGVDFPGFPRETIDFLCELGENNDKAWFEANRERYERFWLAPAVAFVEAVGSRLRERFPRVNYDTRANGSGSLIRIYRDTRFSDDKTPYKSNIAGMFWEGSGRKMGCPGFGFQLNLEGLGLMSGLFGFTKEQLVRYRAAVVDEELGARLAAAAGEVLAAGPYEFEGQEYKRVPTGFDPAHPRADWLLYKGLWGRTREPLPLASVHEPEIVPAVLEHFTRLAPIQRWLVEAVG